MRVLTDPTEIRTFRRKQFKKLCRMAADSARSFITDLPMMVRSMLIYLSLTMVTLAICSVLLAVMLFSVEFILNQALVY